MEIYIHFVFEALEPECQCPRLLIPVSPLPWKTPGWCHPQAQSLPSTSWSFPLPRRWRIPRIRTQSTSLPPGVTRGRAGPLGMKMWRREVGRGTRGGKGGKWGERGRNGHRYAYHWYRLSGLLLKLEGNFALFRNLNALCSVPLYLSLLNWHILSLRKGCNYSLFFAVFLPIW